MNRLLNTAKLDSTNNNLSISHNKREINSSPAFTIIELLVVVAVIAILAVLTLVVYSNITKTALQSSMQSSLSTAYRAITSFQSMNDKMPTSISDCDSSSNAGYKASSTTLCIKPGNNFTFIYSYDNNSSPATFTLYAQSTDNSKLAYKVSSSISSPIASTDGKTCPNNFILVPGSSTYGTSDFCVMKYEAKIYGNDNGAQTYSSSNLPNSRASGTPYVNISQTNLMPTGGDNIAAKTVDAQGNTIAGAHLITEAEWMTIAQNVLQQSTNWSGGSVGSGFIYTGHSNNNPASALAASSNDSDSLNGMTYTGTTVGSNVKRTLTLSNGEIIWDMSGNVWELIQGQTTGHQPGLSTDTTWVWARNWKDATDQNGFPSSSMPSSMASGVLANINSWTTSQGIGALSSYYGDTALRGFLRSGYWSSSSSAGVLYLNLGNTPSNWNASIGFRVASSAQ